MTEAAGSELPEEFLDEMAELLRDAADCVPTVSFLCSAELRENDIVVEREMTAQNDSA